MGGPRIDKVERTSQATPLAEDVLAELQGLLSQGAFGTGVGPLQRESGTAIRQFLASLQQRAGDITGGTSDLLDAVSNRNAEFVNRQATDLREVFGAAGSRFGTQIGRAEGDLRRGAANDFAVTSANTLLQDRNLTDQLLLGTIAQQFGMGQASIQPFLQLAAMGILPEEVIASPGVGQQLLGGALQAGASFLGGPAGAALFAGARGVGGGGGGGTTALNVTPNVTPSFADPNIFGGAGIGLQNPFMRPSFSLPNFSLDPRLMASPILFR